MNIIRATIPVPPSVNRMYRSRAAVYKTEIAVGFEACVKEQIDAVMNPDLPPLPWSVTFRFFFPDRRRRDVDNCIKSGLDAVTRALKVDDCQVNELHAFKDIDRDKPRCEVTIVTVGSDASA